MVVLNTCTEELLRGAVLTLQSAPNPTRTPTISLPLSPLSLDTVVAIQVPTFTMATLLKIYVTCAAVLYFKFAGVAGIQSIKSFDAGSRPPEDKSLGLAVGRRPQTYGLHTGEADAELLKAKVTEKRWKRIVMNDLESVPLALIVFGAGIATSANETVHAVALITYTVMRCAHTYAFVNEQQPQRTRYWQIAVTANLVGAVNGLVGAYRM